MYEAQTYEAILKRMLDRVPSNVDKREGSIIYTALAPAAAELTQMYIELDVNYNLSFADTSSGDDLSRRTAEFGVNREPATKARREGRFYGTGGALMDIPIGSRFSIESVNYLVVSKIGTGVYVMECETAGVIGNRYFGNMLPIQFINGLSQAVLGDILIPGEEEESDDGLRERYYSIVNESPFGGNVADYKTKINSIDGVGAVKVFPVWQGGGTVKCTVIASDWNAPSASLVNSVQATIDPTINSGQGIGVAPIGHKVTVAGVSDSTIHVITTITLASGYTPGLVQQVVEDAISEYLLSLRKEWANQDQIVVRVALVEAAILSVGGVIDVNSTMLNGAASNITLSPEQIPQIGTVVINV